MDSFNAGEASLLEQPETGPKDIMVFCDGTGKDGRSDTVAQNILLMFGGFSRIGLVATEGELLARWSKHERPAPEAAAARTQHVPINLPLNVQNAFHAVAIHENRKLFGVTLFEPNHMTNLKEIWFPGSHSDVGGGGNAITDLPDISLLWMIGEMQVIAPLPKYDMIYPRATRLSSFIPTNECSEDALVMHGLMHQDPAPRPPLGSRYRKIIKYDIHESVYYLQGAAQHNAQMKKAMDEFGWVNPVSKSRIVFCSAFERMKEAHMTALMTLKVQAVQRQIEDVPSRRESTYCRLPSVSPRELFSPSANRSGSASSSDTVLQITREQSPSQETDASEEVIRSDRENIDIMIFCDGESDDGRAERATSTNVWRLYQLILSKDRPYRTRASNGELSSTPKRLCLYMPGLLTLSKANNWEKDVVEPHDICA
ncbi:hypothetical protein FRC09_005810 [Ceratobasidium sp. 395]|nr:hypothetical protein FRC09_005810 [Ceratobasidium sp. 395]